MRLSLALACWLHNGMKLHHEHAKLHGMQWDDLRIFLAVQRGGSHAAAARLVSVDASTIGRRLSALESALGARLFDRTPRGLFTSEAGTELLQRAERVEAEVLAAERALRGADARTGGKVRVTASDGLVTHVLLPRLGTLRRAHPELELELQVENRSLDLSRREADVALRLFRPRQPNLVARRLGAIRFGLYAAASYLETHKSPQRQSELKSHEFVVFDPGFETPEARWLKKTLPVQRVGLRVNTTGALATACAEGHGLALLPTFVVAHDARLVPVLPRLSVPPRDVWAVTHEDVRTKARVVLVNEWLAKIATDLR
jgi:DNA-binding transcriptional LysR family regulator